MPWGSFMRGKGYAGVGGAAYGVLMVLPLTVTSERVESVEVGGGREEGDWTATSGGGAALSMAAAR